MAETRFRWLLDIGLPRLSPGPLDALHVADLRRTPGHAGLREAIAQRRALVTSNQEFRGPWALPLDHPGIVVFDQLPHVPQEVQRNLSHLEFRLTQSQRDEPLAGSRFVVKTDRAILQVLPDGTERDLEQWKEITRVDMAAPQMVSAPGAARL